MEGMPVESLLVVGAGQMGAGIAQVALQAGLSLVLADVSTERTGAGRAMIERGFQKLVERSKVSQAESVAALSRLQTVETIEGLPRVDVAIEAVSENADLKQQIFKRLDKVVRPGGILASNTSSIPITRLAAATSRPEAVIGMHFMNPVPLMALVELIRGAATSDSTYEEAKALALRMGKTTVVSKDFPGFIVNRILIPMLNEACFALAEGIASAADIDTAMKLGTNQPMGPLALSDFIGLDTVLAIAEVLHHGLGEDKYRPAPLLRQYVEDGWLGKKSKRGFFTYG